MKLSVLIQHRLSNVLSMAAATISWKSTLEFKLNTGSLNLFTALSSPTRKIKMISLLLSRWLKRWPYWHSTRSASPGLREWPGLVLRLKHDLMPPIHPCHQVPVVIFVTGLNQLMVKSVMIKVSVLPTQIPICSCNTTLPGLMIQTLPCC